MFHALLTAAFGVEQARLIELGVQVVLVLLPGQFAATFETMLGRTQHHRVFLQQVTRQLHSDFTQLRQRYAFIDQAHLGGFLPAEGLAGHDVVQRLAMAHGVGHGLAHQVARRDAPVDFRKTEGRLVGADRQVAGHQGAEAAAEAPAIDHGNGRLGVHAQQFPLPLRGFAADFFLEDLRASVHFAEVLLEIHARGPGFAGAGQHQYTGGRVLLEGFQDIDHLAVQGRAHGVAFFRAVEDDPRDAFLDFHFDRCPATFVIAHDDALLFLV
ncbi:hypothetical protein D3C76_734230 [compost metagenome]